MPGVNKDGLEITVENGELTIVGHRAAVENRGREMYRESRAFDYRRSFELDPSIDTAKITREDRPRRPDAAPAQGGSRQAAEDRRRLTRKDHLVSVTRGPVEALHGAALFCVVAPLRRGVASSFRSAHGTATERRDYLGRDPPGKPSHYPSTMSGLPSGGRSLVWPSLMHFPKFARLALLFTLLALAVPSRADEAAAFVVADSTTGFILDQYKGDKKLPIGSLTKIATAMVVLDWSEASNTDLGQLATVPDGAAQIAAGQGAGFQPGDRCSLRDLLYAALMQSDNVAALTLADHVGQAIGGAQQPGGKLRRRR